MKKIILSAIVLASISLTSCKDDDDKKTDEGTVDISKMYLPLKMVADDYTTNFTYNNKGQVTKIVESDGFEYSFKYNDNQLVEVVEIDTSTSTASTTTYTYKQNGNTITLNSVYEYNGSKNEDSETLTLDAKGNLIDDEYFTYSYDANGNITQMANKYGEKATFTYDAKNGVFKNLNLPKWVTSYIIDYKPNMVNNAVTIKFESEEDPEDNDSGTIKYDYNADGYPVKMIVDSVVEGNFTQTIEYTKK
ncbi:hypothetical protein H1R17_03695 [Flavobacterium sp. xlx-214]|uniref:hypothetical protein n=1 Tax=unclassified Flavobacterium TaxID=196869 RepID=UPI0013D517E7|nr:MULTISPECIES: hypothetical protein [unclassified Flavobacterium]MBA5791994.1 hypothetical protein [Flavobacterium sp. xlx-221]QMI84248.1 hypothetical protein H1R17_03695 [Flavobacterium sp. xlx-214]